MSESKHTPGPWKYVGRLGFGHLVDPNVAVIYGGEGSGHADDGLANARLISAAPELLNATKLLEQALVYQIRTDTANGDHEGAHLKAATLKLVRATIAKATGGVE
jgi:hypothetical protein